MRRSLASLLLLAVLAPCVRGDEGGLPILRVIAQSEHHGGPQTFDIAQDRRGVLFFGNLKGILTYDGAWWGVTELPNRSAVFAVESDEAGVIAAGGVNEFGFLANGKYRSLVAQLPAAQRAVGEVRGLCTSGRGFVFASERFVIEWNGGAPQVIAALPPGSGAPHCRRIGGTVMLWNQNGLHRIEGHRLADAGLQGRTVDAAIETSGGNALAAVRGEGLFVADRAGNATHLDGEASARAARAIVTDAARLRDGGFAFATRENGVLLLDAKHELRDVLDRDAGLPDTVITTELVDAEGALWLGAEGPLVRVDLASPLRVLDGRRGVTGMPNGVLSDRGRLWIPTSRGLFVMDANRAPGSGARRVDALPAPTWSVVAVDDGILAGTSAGIFHLRDGAAPTRIADTEETFELLRSPAEPWRVWVATRNGLVRLRLDRDRWRVDSAIDGAPPYARGLLEVNGDLWSGTVFNGVVRATPRHDVTHFGSGEMSVALIDGRLVAIRDGHFFRIDANGQLLPDREVDVPGGFLNAAEDAQGNLWLGSEPIHILAKGSREPRVLPGISGTVASITRDASGAMWIATQNGLYRGAPPRQIAPPPAPIIRTAADMTPLPHDFGRLRIEFAPAMYGDGVRYQYRLDPPDANWSDWTAEPFIDYTRLGGGQYTFRLRTRNAAGAVSDEATWDFSVLPPWYRKPLPITLFAFVAAALIALIVKLRTRALRRQADRLRALIAERTQELSEANQHLERLALLDDLTGIPNRRYFDRALARAWEAARDHHSSLSVVLLDLDHFKNLNDEYGHAAGDESLVNLGRLLAQKIRRSGEFASRSGDVVARIGGEEFAVLLAATDADGALRTAETLRTAIAEMEIFFDSTPIRLTVSCGVATMTPGETGSAETLVRRADAALYAAKAAGRNCVRAADGVAARAM